MRHQIACMLRTYSIHVSLHHDQEIFVFWVTRHIKLVHIHLSCMIVAPIAVILVAHLV